MQQGGKRLILSMIVLTRSAKLYRTYCTKDVNNLSIECPCFCSFEGEPYFRESFSNANIVMAKWATSFNKFVVTLEMHTRRRGALKRDRHPRWSQCMARNRQIFARRTYPTFIPRSASLLRMQWIVYTMTSAHIYHFLEKSSYLARLRKKSLSYRFYL